MYMKAMEFVQHQRTALIILVAAKLRVVLSAVLEGELHTKLMEVV